MLNYRMLTPGPTPVPELSLQKLSSQVRHHRTPDFTAILERVIENLKQVFKTEKSSVAILQGSGTSAMDACVSNVIVPGDTALVLYSGKFAERWAELVERYGGKAILYEVPWGERFEPDVVKRYLDDNPQIKAVYGTLVETSTGVEHDIANIGQVISQTEALWIVDGISGAGAVELWTDKWSVDLLAVGSQKALMTPPGLAAVVVSPKAKRVIESTPNRKTFYLDLLKYLDWEKSQGAPFTPARSLIEAMDQSVKMLLEESMETVWADNVLKSQMVRNAVAAWKEKIPGIRIVAQHSSNALTVIHVPESVNVKSVLTELEQSYGIKLAGAQGDWKGKAFRISNMGMVDRTDILSVISALDVILTSQTGVDVIGVGSSSAQKTLLERK